MRLVNLVENISGSSGCPAEHGLCIYVETAKHRLLADTGASGLFAENAKKKGIDLTKVDTVILSHGHYDHGGGIPEFARINPDAKIYMQDCAEGDYYSTIDGLHYIGLPREIRDLPQVVRISGSFKIDEELQLFADIPFEEEMPPSNRPLRKKQGDEYVQDDFRHEQYLVIREGNMHVLLSGCAHHGILNIMSHYRKMYGSDPDYVISGFHLMQKDGYSEEDIRSIGHTACVLRSGKTVFYTGHCTGEKPFEVLKNVLGDRIHYFHCGDEIELTAPEEKVPERKAERDEAPSRKKKSKFMKWHRFFAGAAAVCFVMTMITGYRRK